LQDRKKLQISDCKLQIEEGKKGNTRRIATDYTDFHRLKTGNKKAEIGKTGTKNLESGKFKNQPKKSYTENNYLNQIIEVSQ
jgi:hypothetical protein